VLFCLSFGGIITAFCPLSRVCLDVSSAVVDEYEFYFLPNFLQNKFKMGPRRMIKTFSLCGGGD